MLRDPSPPMETPISVRREARNTGFVVYMSFTMEPPPTLRPSSFTVNWKSNPLTNSWTEGERVFSHEITILPWYRLTISLLRILYLSEGGRNSRVSSRRDKGIQESTVVSLMCSFRKFVQRKKNETEKRGKYRKNVTLLTIQWDREMFIFFEFEIEIGRDFRMRRVKRKSREKLENSIDWRFKWRSNAVSANDDNGGSGRLVPKLRRKDKLLEISMTSQKLIII